MNRKTLTYEQAKILKHWGDLQSVKVSYETVDGVTRIHIHDFEFYSFERALQYLQRNAQSVVTDDIIDDRPHLDVL